VVVCSLWLFWYPVAYEDWRLLQQCMGAGQCPLIAECVQRACMGYIVLVRCCLSTRMGLGIGKPMLLPLVFAAGVLSSEGLLADTTDAVRSQLRRLPRVLLADVPGAVALSVTSGELCATITTSCDIALRLPACVLCTRSGRTYCFGRDSARFDGFGDGSRSRMLVGFVVGQTILDQVSRSLAICGEGDGRVRVVLLAVSNVQRVGGPNPSYSRTWMPWTDIRWDGER